MIRIFEGESEKVAKEQCGLLVLHCLLWVAHLVTAIVDAKDCIVTTKAEIRALDDGVKDCIDVATATAQRKQNMRITQH